MTPNPQDQRIRAYKAGAQLSRERIAREAPLDAEALNRIIASDILVVPGSYDHVELVLAALEMPYTTVAPHQLARLRMRPEQLLIINCPGDLSREAICACPRLRRGRRQPVHHRLGAAQCPRAGVPRHVAYNEQPTADTVVRIEIIDRANPFLAGVMEDGDAPVWWLEGSSYPIRILAPERVQVLLSSAELAGRYGEAPVAIQFRHGAGEVFHMISHYYLQRTELRGERHAKPASFFAEEKGIVPDAAMQGAMAGLKVGDVESAHASARFLSNVIAKKKRGQSSVR